MREAYVSPNSNQVRVTFDRLIQGTPFDRRQCLIPPKFTEGIRPKIGGVVLEMKFTDRFPPWMRDAVLAFNLQRGSMAKYVTCVEAMGIRPGLRFSAQMGIGAMNNFVDMLFNGDFGVSAYGPQTAFFILLLAFVIGQFVGWIYMWTHRGLSYSQSFVASLVVIPVIVSMMMMLMSGSIVFAFGLLAVFAVVRFRNVLKDTRDTTFILWSIMEGLGVGTLRYSTALMSALGIAMVLVYLRMTSFGSRHRFDAVLSLQLTGDLAGGVARLKQILYQHSSRALLASERKLTDEGLSLSYRLLLRDPARSDELQWALRQTEGVENVSLFMREDEAEV